MSTPTIYKTLRLTDRFEAAFPDKRVPNGDIDKGKTRVGITYTNFHDARHSISVIPYVPIIEEAIDEYHALDLFEVKDGVTPQMITAYLNRDISCKRIVTTPESFGKIISAAKSIGKLQWLYDEFFLYLDESHCYAVDGFRQDILTLFKWLWNFKNKAFGTATHFSYSNPRFAKLQQYRLCYGEKFGKITIISDLDPMAVLNYMLTHPDMFPGNVHIYFNTVTGIGEAITLAQLKRAAVFCRDDDKNKVNLGDASVHFKSRPKKGEYEKFNFYSCRYNEGWALEDDETATIILVTDVRVAHSLVGIPYKGFQAMGRLNDKDKITGGHIRPHKRYHITNDFGRTGMKSFDAIQQQCLYNHQAYIDAYNAHVMKCARDKMEDDGQLKELVTRFAEFDGIRAAIHYEKTDQIICEKWCKEHYNNREAIRQTWESVNYETEVMKFDLPPLNRFRKSEAELNKQMLELLEQWEQHPEQYVFGVASATMQKHKVEFDVLFQFRALFGSTEIKKLNHETKAMKTKLIEQSNQNAEAKLRVKLAELFQLNERYSFKEIKEKLQALYNELKIRNKDGQIRKATAAQLNDFGMFQLEDAKVPSSKLGKDGKKAKTDNGYKVVKLLYALKQAA